MALVHKNHPLHSTTYETNLNTLLSSLFSAAAADAHGFANATASKNPLDLIYRLFLCQLRGI